MDAPVITAISVSAGVVTLTLTGDGSISIYSRPAGTADWTLSATAASTDDPIEISGLTAGLTYEFYAVADGLGPELVINGGFDTDTGWVRDPVEQGDCWVISAGMVWFFPPSTDTPYAIEQTIDITAGKTYRVSIDTVDWDESHLDDFTVSAFLGGTGIPLSGSSGIWRVVAGSTDSKIRLVGTSAVSEVSAFFDNVSVREESEEPEAISPPSNVVRAFIYADGLSAIVNLEKWIIGKIENIGVFKTVDSLKGQIGDDGGLAAFLKFAPFAFVWFDHIAPNREGGYDLNHRVGFSILVGAADDTAGVARLGSAAKPGASLLMDYVITALEGVHPGEGFTCDDFFFAESQIAILGAKMSAIQIGVEANWMVR